MRTSMHLEELPAQPASPTSPGLQAASAPGNQGQDDTFPFAITVGQVFDGPLDLLLALIRKQDIDIYDIPIATITAQFRACVAQFKADEVETAAEFVYMAAQLISIKAKLLLPSEAAKAHTDDDPRRELVNRLFEHERFKQAAQMLSERQQLEQSAWTNPGIRDFGDNSQPGYCMAPIQDSSATTVDLVKLWREMMDRSSQPSPLIVQQESVTVAVMVDYLRRRLQTEHRPVTLTSVLAGSTSSATITATFLALLEMVRMGAVLLHQEQIFGDIRIKKSGQFEEVVSQSIPLSEEWD
jgi:segregation and condensation protein A